MPEPKTQVIVATEHEQVVRIYAGHVGNGGINQTGQFTSNRPIDPTDLANMAVDLSATFGWLQVHEVEPVKQRALPKVKPHGLEAYLPKAELPARGTPQDTTPHVVMLNALPPVGADKRAWVQREADKVPCPECDAPYKRTSLSRHLDAVHGWRVSTANEYARRVPPLVKSNVTANGAVPRWSQLVRCPVDGCGHVAKRSNMTTHLQMKIHGMERAEANRIAGELPAHNDTPQPNLAASVRVIKPHVPSTKPRGVQGAHRLVSEVYPRIVAVLRERGPMTTTQLAEAINEERQATRKHLQRAEANGMVRDVSPANRGPNDVKTWASVD